MMISKEGQDYCNNIIIQVYSTFRNIYQAKDSYIAVLAQILGRKIEKISFFTGLSKVGEKLSKLASVLK